MNLDFGTIGFLMIPHRPPSRRAQNCKKISKSGLRSGRHDTFHFLLFYLFTIGKSTCSSICTRPLDQGIPVSIAGHNSNWLRFFNFNCTTEQFVLIIIPIHNKTKFKRIWIQFELFDWSTLKVCIRMYMLTMTWKVWPPIDNIFVQLQRKYAFSRNNELRQ